MYYLSWQEAFAAGPAVVGGKGWNLGRLHRYQFPVPPGAVLSSAAYRRFMSALSLSDVASITLENVTTPETTALLTTLRNQIMATDMPEAMANELTAGLSNDGLLSRPVAVRSSATAEDSAAASFAGIHQSFLNVTGQAGILEAVKACYASLWTPQAVAYRRRLNLADDEVAAAVVILAMVEARTAGVCFTCDPRTGRRDLFALSAAPGLGEAVVSGATEPDEYLVRMTQYPPEILSRQVGHKTRMTVARPEGGTALVEAPAGMATLSDEAVRSLAALAGRVQDALGQLDQPQDIEWAHDGRQFWLLQSRPVTSLPPPTFAPVANQPVVWSNANLRDVMPGVVSPLGWSFMRSGMDVLLRSTLDASGYRYEGGMTWIRLFEGRAYFNLSAMQWAYYDSIGIKPDELNRVLGGHQPELRLPATSTRGQAARAVRELRLVSTTLRTLRTAPGLIRRYWQWAEQAEAVDYDAYTHTQFLDRSLEVKAIMEAFMPVFQIINGGAGGIHSELIKRLTPAFGDRAPGLVNAMLAGSESITSAEQGQRLVTLGNQALHEEAVRAYFTAADWQPALWRERLTGTRFLQGFEAYLKEYGHRGVYELEPMNPRWRENPAYLLETVRSQVLSGREIRLEGAAAKRDQARSEVFARLRFTPLIRFYLKQAATAAAYREWAKSALVKLMGITRMVALAAGRRMAAEGLLDSPDDVFHLSWLDLEAYLTGKPGCGGFRTLVADRKALRAHYLATEPPDVIIGEEPVAKAPPPAAAGAVMTGTGVAAGRAAGTARVVLHPEQGSRLQPGEVLVAPSTDPAWTPLFLRASAIVMEVGGYLSHGAIVAREYGLPAVVNIPGLLRTVKEGEHLTVDGDSGKVYRQR